MCCSVTKSTLTLSKFMFRLVAPVLQLPVAVVEPNMMQELWGLAVQAAVVHKHWEAVLASTVKAMLVAVPMEVLLVPWLMEQAAAVVQVLREKQAVPVVPQVDIAVEVMAVQVYSTASLEPLYIMQAAVAVVVTMVAVSQHNGRVWIADHNN